MVRVMMKVGVRGGVKIGWQRERPYEANTATILLHCVT